MKQTQVIIGGLVLIGIVIFFFYILGDNPKTDKQMSSQNSGTLEEQGSVNQKVVATPQYINYSKDALTTSAANKKQTVLFFAALAWCPTCQAADKDFQANASEIPQDVTVLIVNYDTEKELKAQYGIVQQHTFVLLGPDGKETDRWIGGGVTELRAKTL